MTKCMIAQLNILQTIVFPNHPRAMFLRISPDAVDLSLKP